MKKRFYQYLAGVIAVGAVLCFIVGIIIGNKGLPFVGMLLIAVGLTALINPLIKDKR